MLCPSALDCAGATAAAAVTGAVAAAGATGPAATSTNAAAVAPKAEKMRTGRWGPVRTVRLLYKFNSERLAALARTSGSRVGRSGRSGRGRCTLIVLAIVDITVNAAVIVTVGPDRAGETANRSTDHRAFENAEARNDRTGGRTESCATDCASRNATEGRVIALRS